jgi:uncharacterized LabA/DUF88 family protein
MDRAAIFVDAGYLLAAAGALCVGSSNRADMVCDIPKVHIALRNFAEVHGNLGILRTYWYDAGPQGQPTSDHKTIEALPNVKLRLGRLTQYGQKGVDSKVTRDLMTLARERAMSVAYLLSGDEDLREGVIAAQDFGVQVVLLGIPGVRSNQAATLINEADEHVVLDRAFWEPHFSSAAPLLFTGLALEAAQTPTEVGALCADEWFGQFGRDEARELVDQAPLVPSEVDRPLLAALNRRFGSVRQMEGFRKEVRNGFTERLRSLLG